MFYENFLGHIGVLLQLQLLQFVFGLHTSSILPLYYIKYNIKFHFDFWVNFILTATTATATQE